MRRSSDGERHTKARHQSRRARGLTPVGEREHESVLKLERLREAIRIGEEAIERGEYRDAGLDGLKEYLAELAETRAPAPQTIMTNKPAAARGAGRS